MEDTHPEMVTVSCDNAHCRNTETVHEEVAMARDQRGEDWYCDECGGPRDRRDIERDYEREIAKRRPEVRHHPDFGG